MFMLISPAKTLDFETPPGVSTHSQPAFQKESQALIKNLRRFSPAELASLMKLSDALATLNVTRYQEWSLPFTIDNSKQAVLSFAGDVYEGLDASSLSAADLKWAQGHLGILSGLYGLLKPLDLIQPYRLEMGTRLENPRGKDLYAWWGDILQQAVVTAAQATKSGVVVNLASEEYFKAVKVKGAKGVKLPVLQPVFEDWKGEGYKVISFYAKRARGLMVRYAIQHRIDKTEQLKKFDMEGYRYAPEASDGTTWVFRRRSAA